MKFTQLLAELKRQRQQMIDDMIEMLAIEAINPRSGGSGEYKRAEWLRQWLLKRNISYEIFEVADEIVPEKKRLSLISRLAGKKKEAPTLWFIAHLDTVHYGDIGKWQRHPLKPEYVNGKVFGLGAEDNGQAIISQLYLLALLHKYQITPEINLSFIFVSDEEAGSNYGLKPMIKAGLFQKGDLAIVPDSGNSEGSFVEIAEKSVLWIKFIVLGQQAHGSRPHTGINASSIGARLSIALEDGLRKYFTDKDDLFTPSFSTFELTQKFTNVPSVNVIPGKDIFCMDMRILPHYQVDQVLAVIDSIIEEQQKSSNTQIYREIIQKTIAPSATSPQSPLIRTLLATLHSRDIEAYCGGIGGITCASILRAADVETAVWSTIGGMAHQVNEYSLVDNWLQDMEVFLDCILSFSF
jgi:succinyl-diaminopimelate desuccinylase